ncbi:MAG TPA: helix-turn-helix domain-containing protein [Microbacteriaceae bacterium]
MADTVTAQREATPEAAANHPFTPSVCDAANRDSEMIRNVLSRIGDKWTLLVVGVLQSGPLRFTVLQHRVRGISQRMLTLTLKQLERDGLASRTSYPEIPPRVEYELTTLGHTLIAPVLGLAAWASTHGNTIEANKAAFDDAREASIR